MIQLSGLTKAFGDRVLLEAVSWQIDDRERVGLAGPNGAGKTTLLKMLAGLDEPDSGQVVKPSALAVGYLPQDGLTHSGRTLIEEAGLAFKPLLDMRAEIQSLEERLGDDSATESEHAAMLARYSELQESFRRLEGYSIDLKITTVLRGLGFVPDDFDKPSETFSGGWQMRIALAKLLLTRPGLLLLDEPTNHLDLEARNWLEEYLSGYPHAVILVSHDRFFLDAVVTRITEIGLRKLTDYAGNYSGYLVEREARMERLRQQKRDQDDEIERMQAFINRFRYQATKASQVQSRIKMMDKIVPIEIPPERKRVHFTFPACAKSGRTVLDLRDVRKAYGTRVVFDGRSSMRATANRVRSPPDNTRTGLSTSSPEKRKPPRMLRMLGTMCIGASPARVWYTVNVGSRRVASSCAKYCITTWWPSVRVPESGASTPDSIRISVDFPAPLGPMSAMRSPRSMRTLTPPKTVRPSYALRTSRRSSTVRPLFAHGGNVKCTRLRSGGISMGTIFSRILMRLCTWDAFVAV